MPHHGYTWYAIRSALLAVCTLYTWLSPASAQQPQAYRCPPDMLAQVLGECRIVVDNPTNPSAACCSALANANSAFCYCDPAIVSVGGGAALNKSLLGSVAFACKVAIRFRFVTGCNDVPQSSPPPPPLSPPPYPPPNTAGGGVFSSDSPPASPPPSPSAPPPANALSTSPPPSKKNSARRPHVPALPFTLLAALLACSWTAALH